MKSLKTAYATYFQALFHKKARTPIGVQALKVFYR